MLQDKTGQMDSKIWDPSSGGICDFDAMDYVAVTGQVISFNGALQLKIERIRKADEGEYVPSDYIPCSKYDIEEMYTELMQYIGSVKNEYLSALLKSFLQTMPILLQSLRALRQERRYTTAFWADY